MKGSLARRSAADLDDDVVEAHRHLEKGLHAGKKIVVTV
jgi:hypothetical protein